MFLAKGTASFSISISVFFVSISSKDFAKANLYEATFLPRRMIDLHEVSSVGFLSTNNSLFIVS